jgi:hypothetical protein
MATPLDQLSPKQQRDAAYDEAKYPDASPMKVNGAPVGADEQTQLDAAKRGGPAAMAQFVQTWLPRLQQIPDPQQRQHALAGFANALQTPVGTPILGQQAQTQNAPSVPAAPTQLAGPAELKSLEGVATGDADNFKAYKAELNASVHEGLALQQRNAEIRANLQQFQAGLAGGHIRTDIASNLAASFPDSPAIQSAANALAGGDVTAAQTFNNLIAGAAVTNANQVLDHNGRLNKGIITLLTQAAESSKTDPGALSRIMDIQDRLVDQLIVEQKFVADKQQSGTLNPSTIEAEWAQYRRNAMRNGDPTFAPVSLQPVNKISPRNPSAYPPAAASATGAPQSWTSPSGKRFEVVGQ